jgi:hypothetical protein
MQLTIFETLQDTWNYSDKRVMIGLSGGINSAAVLAYLAKNVIDKPKELFLFYAHFEEHSDDTFSFVNACIDYAKNNFKTVHFTKQDNSINQLFRDKNFIPHPKISECTKTLKILPIIEYMAINKIDVDLVGYVRSERNRINRQIRTGAKNKEYLISHLTDDDCFSLVKQEIGWFPAIYNIKWNDERIIPFLKCHKQYIPEKDYLTALKYAVRGYGYFGSSRVFAHNNCLPCKNMATWEIYLVKLFYPEKFEKAMETANITESYWGRDADGLNESGQNASCAFCAFD